MRYLTWRDSKTAIIVFSKNKNLSTVLSAIRKTAMEHPNFDTEEQSPTTTEFRFVFHRNDDTSRQFKLAVLVFEMPRGTLANEDS
jgi:hypothetical protein